MIEQFLEMIQNVIALKDEVAQYDNFFDMESWFVEHDTEIFELSEEICRLGYEMQDQIAEMEYMEDNSQYISEIKKIYEQMQEDYKTMKRAKRYNKTFNR